MSEKPVSRPYDAKHVQIVDRGLTVTALYIPDAEQAKDPAYVLENILDSRYADVEVVATATRCYKSEGATVSGWFISSGPDHGSEGYPNKRVMREALDYTISGYFTRSTDQETSTVTETSPRYVVNPLGNGYFAIRDTVTDLDVATKTSRSGAQHIADCLADGTMVLDSLGKAVAAQKPVVETSGDTREYGVFEDGECIEAGFHGGYGRVAAGATAKTYADDPANAGLSYEVKELCPDHEEQPKHGCEECYAGEDEEG